MSQIGHRNVLLTTVVFVICFSSLASARTVAYWRFEEWSANAGASNPGTIVDSSSNGHAGSPFGTPVYRSNVQAPTVYQSGATNTLALDFNGIDQRINIPDSSAFALTHSLTLEALVYVRYASGWTHDIVFRGDDRNDLDPYRLAVIDGKFVFQITDILNERASVSADVPAVNAWYHVAGTLDDTTGDMKLFVNGIQAASAATTKRPLGPLDPGYSPGLGIGNNQGSYHYSYFDGLIDEVRISDQALSPGQFLVPEPMAFGWMSLTIIAVRRPKRRGVG